MLLRRVIAHVKTQNWTAVALGFVLVISSAFFAIPASYAQDSPDDLEARFLKGMSLCQFMMSGGAADEWKQEITCVHGQLRRIPNVLEPQKSHQTGIKYSAARGDELYREDLQLGIQFAQIEQALEINGRRFSKSFEPLTNFDRFYIDDLLAYCSVDLGEPSQAGRDQAKVTTVTGQPLLEATCLRDEDSDGSFDAALHRRFGQATLTRESIDPIAYHLMERTSDLEEFIITDGTIGLQPISRIARLKNLTARGVRVEIARGQTSSSNSSEIVVPFEDEQALVSFNGLEISFYKDAEDRVRYSITGAFEPWVIFK